MNRSLAQIREDSRQALAGNYFLFFIVLFIASALTMAADQLLSYFAPLSGREGFVFLTVINLILNFIVLILAKLLQAGQCFLSLNIARYNRVSVSDLFLAFRYDTSKALVLSVILGLIETICTAPLTISLSCVLYYGSIIPGTQASIATSILTAAGGFLGMILLEVLIAFPFSQSFFLYIDHQEYSALECLSESRSLMRGKILDFFLLHLSLAGYFALCVVSLGIGLIWVLPYLNVIRASYYMNLTGLYKPY